MKKLIYIVGVVIVSGCSRNIPVPVETFDMVKKACETFKSTQNK